MRIKIYLLLTTLTFSLSGFSQIMKNDFFIYGNIGFSSGSRLHDQRTIYTDSLNMQSSYRQKTFNFNTSIGANYLLTDHLSIGLDLGYTIDRPKVDQRANRTSTYQIMPKIGYVINYKESLSMILDLGLGRHMLISSYSGDPVDHRYRRGYFVLAFTPTLLWRMHERVFLDIRPVSVQLGNIPSNVGAYSPQEQNAVSLRMHPVQLGIRYRILTRHEN